MSFSLNRIFLSSLVAGVMSLGSAFAGQVTFHLPMQAHWGNKTMEPGDYRVTVPDMAIGTQSFYWHGGSNSAYQLASRVEFAETGKKSYLRLLKVNGEYFVKQFVSADKGRIYSFLTPKPRYHQEISEHVVPVETAGTK